MGQVKAGYLSGTFKGFRDRETVFTFTDGRQWQQDEDRYEYHYVVSAVATISEELGTHYIEISSVPGRVRVRKV
jgi:hypothetical protein